MNSPSCTILEAPSGVPATGEVDDEPGLLDDVRGGDLDAFEILYRRHWRAARSFATRIVRCDHDADDVTSEAFVNICRRLLAGGGPHSRFRAYLFTAVRNAAYDRARRDKRLVFCEEVAHHDRGHVQEDPAMTAQERAVIARAFARLPQRWQYVLWYTSIEGLKPAEVAPLLGISSNATAALAVRAREGLRRAYLQEHLPATEVHPDCEALRDRLGALTRAGVADRDAAQVQAHLRRCVECLRLADRLARVNVGLQNRRRPGVTPFDRPDASTVGPALRQFFLPTAS